MPIRTTTRTVAASVGLATAAAVLVSAPTSQAAQAGRAHVVVTIKAEGTDLSGTVRSKRRACKANRTVLLFKQKGAKGGADDSLFATDTTSLQNGKWVWNTGNLGTEGRFYAKVKRTALCKRAISPTVRAQRND
jgi:hypothetical protein